MKCFFLTFCDTQYEKTLLRIKNEAVNMNFFDEILCYTEKDFTDEFLAKYKDFIEGNKRGYGYWIWKPFFILQTLNEKMSEDDILVYADGGCTLNNNGLGRLNDYINILEKSQFGIISFQTHHLEKTWTKMDLFFELNCNDSRFLDSFQISATSIIMKKCKNVVSIFEDCMKIIDKNNFHFVDDSQSFAKNDITFIEHRHDQSILSLLRKKYGSELLSDETSICYPWGKDGKNYPIWGTRKRF